MIPILGMHRSGTSALAGSLHKLGGDLGPESSWIAPAADNPAGFFEYEPILSVNRSIFAAFGGTWSSPPALLQGWPNDDRLDAERERARQLAEEASVNLIVKDPRLSLTLPFWETVTEVHSAIVCVRHPAAVARSLQKRNGFTIDQGLFLWFRYNAATTLNSPDALVVEFENLVQSPALHLERVASHVGLDMSIVDPSIGSQLIEASMVHHEEAPLPHSPIGQMCERLYRLIQSGGEVESDHDLWLWMTLVTGLPGAGSADREVAMAHNAKVQLEKEISRMAEQHRRLLDRNARLEADLRLSLKQLDRLAVAEAAALLADLEGPVRD